MLDKERIRKILESLSVNCITGGIITIGINHLNDMPKGKILFVSLIIVVVGFILGFISSYKRGKKDE